MNGTKSTFWVSMGLLLALTVGGGVFGYKVATTEVHQTEGGAGGEASGHNEETPNTANTGEGQQNSANGEQGQPEGTEQNANTGTGTVGGTALDGGTNPSQEASPERPGADEGQQTGDDQQVTPEESLNADPTSEGEGGAEPGSGDETDTSAASTEETLARTGDPAQGQRVFAANCSGCHGGDAKGGVGPNLTGNDGPKTWTLAQFTATLREGKTPDRVLSPAMPRFSEEQIPEASVADLHMYIRSMD